MVKNIGQGTLSHRARMALNRLSRDRWISGKECMLILHKLTHGNNSAIKAASYGFIEYVGIVRGQPPVDRFNPYWLDALKAVKSGKSDTEIMIKLLTIVARKK